MPHSSSGSPSGVSQEVFFHLLFSVQQFQNSWFTCGSTHLSSLTQCVISFLELELYTVYMPELMKWYVLLPVASEYLEYWKMCLLLTGKVGNNQGLRVFTYIGHNKKTYCNVFYSFVSYIWPSKGWILTLYGSWEIRKYGLFVIFYFVPKLQHLFLMSLVFHFCFLSMVYTLCIFLSADGHGALWHSCRHARLHLPWGAPISGWRWLLRPRVRLVVRRSIYLWVAGW